MAPNSVGETPLVTQTLSYGIQKGESFNDIVKIGGFPEKQEILRIQKIKLAESSVLDGVAITYKLADGSSVVADHLSGNTPTSEVKFNDTEVLVGVTGHQGIPNFYDDASYLCYLKFIICDTKTGAVRVEGPYGAGADHSKYTGKAFAVAGTIIAFAGRVMNLPDGDPKMALTLSFIKSASVNRTSFAPNSNIVSL